MTDHITTFEISSAALGLAVSISEKIGKLEIYKNLDNKPHLRRNNRIKSIHSSLAIEANSLSLKEVRDVIAGHTVLGSETEILEVKNAYEAYAQIAGIDPYSLKDLKKVHRIMTQGLIPDAGSFRKGEEGVFDGEQVIFIAPPPQNVPVLMDDLFTWMRRSKDQLNPLILSSVFHYEFLFIHPFSDGNGRMARLWQTVILSKWRDIFLYLPIESQIEKDQSGYYKAIADCHGAGRSDIFIEYMLDRIDKALDDAMEQSTSSEDQISVYVGKLLDNMEYDVPYTASNLMSKIGIKTRDSFRNNYLRPAMDLGIVEMTIPDKPNSKNQRYIKR